ncbi:hypothetical protein [Anaerophilus nitritogenes]|uniref:hypothetical protein n=1 Tax=Anaerophilus nitritogenes TaxID=2498136 RepID=UPI00101D8A24|nr:hypothetical protein [Anaerophilus nitritogenes]
MLSMQTINDLLELVNRLDIKIKQNKDAIDLHQLEYLTYQKIKILQLIDDLNCKESYFNYSNK